ncbi:MAG: DUF5916 domain-containing protein [Cyclobacteriaceae bacterium]
MKATNNWFAFILFLFSSFCYAQNLQNEADYNMSKAPEKIKIDGILNEEAWASAVRAGGFYQSFPTDNQPALDSTQFMITYDDQNLYVGIICYDYLPGKPITNTLKRDFPWQRNDNVSFYVDPYNDKSNGFTFQITPDNVQREGLVILGGEVQDDWDNKWFSAVSKGENVWYAEMAIPFKSIRYNSVPKWNIQFIRNNQKRNERSTWIQVPQQFRASDMVYSGGLNWDIPPPEAGTNVTLIPYVSASNGQNFEDNESAVSKADAGFDAKIGVSNSINLDLTFNPDFSQVEVDQQVTNLQRFEISFPERRQFFLENQDLFAQNGFRSTRPFFSRRIGIQGSGSTQRNVPIIGGARLSGKIGSKWRVGILNMVTNEDKTIEEISPAQNYSVAVLERQVFQRSRISAVFVGRTNLGDSFAEYDSLELANNNQLVDLNGNNLTPEDTLLTLSAYNYVYGLDYNLATVNNRWGGNFYYHRSTDPEKKDDNSTFGGFLRYQTTKYNARIFSRSVGEGYNAEVGFVQRKGVVSSGGRLDINYFTEGKVQRHGPSIGGDFLVDRDGNRLDNSISGNYEVQFLNSSQIEFGFRWETVLLTRSFDPSGTDGTELAENDEFNWSSFSLEYSSDNRKSFTYSVSGRTGGYYNGNRSNISANILYRYQPIFQLGVNFEYNKIELPDPFNDADLFLVGPRFDLTLTNKVFFTSFIQYNTQDENLGHNSRFQWRFKPVSDLFIVYTDNYRTGDFSTRNRAIVVKLSYWLNL